MAIDINNLATEINRQLALYANQTEETVQEIAEKVADDGVEMLRNESPKNTGDYAKSWDKKKVGKKLVVHNKKHYQLTHLLEKGHVKVGGGRVPARVHIKPAETRMVNDFEDRLRRGLSR